ncbi:ROK family protein [Listeria fleischmannii]|jgi:predicted NBD/HSP70 family sugar kinase|uniref:ROK family protein n=1 Tax=Listeria fleischmannii TaxID=1069827 RepID=UPI0016298E7B|nr:ROK family protein [Listeria fleischmannii]MBC1419820.1 ROK family protein [Listeria fleischmannii]
MELLVFDFGGTSVKGGVFQNDKLLDTFSFPTPSTWAEMKALLKNEQDKRQTTYSFKGVAISAPGVVLNEEGIIDGISAIPYIHHFPIKQELMDLFELPVAMINDANAAGMAEALRGAAKGLKRVLFLILGTGVGGVFIQDGQLYVGKHGYAGEYGMIFLEGEKTFSELGTVVRLVERYSKQTNEATKNLSGEIIFERAKNGDQIAQDEIQKFYRTLALGIFNLQVAFDPDCIVLGGGISSRATFLDEIKAEMTHFLKEKEWEYFAPELRQCAFQNQANLIGAVEYFKSIQK